METLNEQKLQELCHQKLNQLSVDDDTKKRYAIILEKELKEISKQKYFKFIENELNKNVKKINKNQNLFWFLLGVTDEFDENQNGENCFISGSMPDIDLDFETGAREIICEYLQKKYGHDKACFIGTMGELKVRSAILDISRQLKIDPQEVFPVTKTIPADSTFEQAIDNKTVQAFFAKYPDVLKYLRYLMNTYRQFGTHAGGILVSSENLMDKCCIVRTAKGLVTGFRESGEIRDLEYIGFIKFDVLGLSTLNQLKECLNIIGCESIHKLPNFTLDDKKVYKNIFWHGHTANIFQLETQLGTEWCKKIKPESIEDLADISTLIRPGCLSAGVPEIYRKRKFDKEPYEVHRLLEKTTKHTYGLLLYQEQIMHLISDCSGGKIGLSEAYIYLKKIGANDEKSIKSFIEKCVDLSSEEIKQIIDQIIKQSQYSFNKSHSVSYSTISYYQAFLKYYYPLQYWLAALKSSSGDLNKTSYYINCAKVDNVEIMPVDILSSEDTYAIKNGKIYCGLQMAKGVKNDVYQLLKARSNKQFDSIQDFISRLAKEEFKFGKRLCVPLVRIGAFSGLCKNIKCLEAILCSSKKELVSAIIPNENSNEYSEKEKYQFEVDYIGLPMRFDYLKRYRDELLKSGAVSVTYYEQALEKDEITAQPFYGIISNITKKTTKKSPPREYLIITLADANHTANITIWPNEIEKYGNLLKRGNLLLAYIAHNQYGNSLQRISNALMEVSL